MNLLFHIHPHLLSLSRPQVPLRSVFESLFARNGRNSLYGFRTFCTGQDLTTKKCVPCDTKDLRPMAEDSAKHLMPKVVGWDLVNENGILKLNRSLKVKSFTKGLELFKLVADVAEVEGHHPDLHLVGWNNVQIEIWTHAVGKSIINEVD